MRAALRRLHSPDSPEGIEHYAPADPSDFSILVQALVGPAGSEGEESFNFLVMSPAALAREITSRDGYAFLRHRLVLNEWNRVTVEQAISDLVRRTEGADWHEIGVKLSRFGAWEFEDYRPFQG